MSITLTQSPISYDLYLYPSGDNATALNIYPTSPTTHYDKVDEVRTSPNDDTDYVYCNTAAPAKIDMFNIQNHTSETGTINYVRVVSRAKAYPSGQAPSGEYKHRIVCGAGTALSSNYAPLSSSYQVYSTVWTTRPADGLAWTWTDIDALVTGLSISSPSITGSLQLILRPNAAGVINQLTRWTSDNYDGAGDATNYTYVDDVTPDNNGTYVRTLNGLDYKDSYNLPNHTTESGTINYVAVFYRAMEQATDADGYMTPLVYIGSNYYYGTEVYPPRNSVWTNYSYAWLLNPNTSLAWTWTDIDNLQIGLYPNTHGANRQTCITQVYAVVDYNQSYFPEARVTQQYVVVNYSPNPSTVTLLAPNEVRYTNTRRTERFIFPDGTYCIGDYGRGGRKLSMKGTEVTAAITNMRLIRAMLDNPFPVTISGLQDVNQDIAWRLNDFNYEYDSSGDHYDWNAELTAYDAVV